MRRIGLNVRRESKLVVVGDDMTALSLDILRHTEILQSLLDCILVVEELHWAPPGAAIMFVLDPARRLG